MHLSGVFSALLCVLCQCLHPVLSWNTSCHPLAHTLDDMAITVELQRTELKAPSYPCPIVTPLEGMPRFIHLAAMSLTWESCQHGCLSAPKCSTSCVSSLQHFPQKALPVFQRTSFIDGKAQPHYSTRSCVFSVRAV